MQKSSKTRQLAKEITKQVMRGNMSLQLGNELIDVLDKAEILTPEEVIPTSGWSGVCPNCGNEVFEHQKHCPECGKKLKWWKESESDAVDCDYVTVERHAEFVSRETVRRTPRRA